MRREFPLGQLVATPGALDALQRAGQSPREFLRRHETGDWGEVGQEDANENDRSVLNELRILSAYRTKNNDRIWIITEADRTSTCILLPEEY